jgi:hypothetical protein
MNNQDPFKSVVKLAILYYGLHIVFVWPVMLGMDKINQRNSLTPKEEALAWTGAILWLVFFGLILLIILSSLLHKVFS